MTKDPEKFRAEVRARLQALANPSPPTPQPTFGSEQDAVDFAGELFDTARRIFRPDDWAAYRRVREVLQKNPGGVKAVTVQVAAKVTAAQVHKMERAGLLLRSRQGLKLAEQPPIMELT